MEFKLEKATKVQYGEVADLIQTVWNQIEDKTWFSKDSSEAIIRALEEKRSFAYVAIETGSQRLSGVFIATIPGMGEGNLGRDIGMEGEMLTDVAHMDYAAILPKYRGNRLQYQLMQMGEEDMRVRGYHYLMCTVHPENKYSMENVLKQGYMVMKTKEKYGGVVRNILLKEL